MRYVLIGSLGVCLALKLWGLITRGVDLESVVWVGFFAFLMVGLALTGDMVIGKDGRPQRGQPAEEEHEEDGPLVSLVLLLREARYLDERVLSNHVQRAWGVELGENEDAESFVAGSAPSFIVKLGDRAFLVNSFAMNYFGDPGAAARAADEMGELRLRKIAEEHGAWISVDLIERADQTDLQDAYRWIGKLIAELADDDCMAILAPAIGRVNVYNERLRLALCGPDPLALFGELSAVPVLAVSADDPAMKRAVAEARRRWPEFEQAFAERSRDPHFAVKAPFTDREQTEFMWMTVTAIEHGTIYGKLANDPVHIRKLAAGSIVRVKVADINDWLFVDQDKMHGAFTLEAIRRAQKED